MQAVQQLLQQISQVPLQDRIFAAHQLAALLETEEAKYRTHVGDPHENPSLRYHYTIGKVLAAVKVRSLPSDGCQLIVKACLTKDGSCRQYGFIPYCLLLNRMQKTFMMELWTAGWYLAVLHWNNRLRDCG